MKDLQDNDIEVRPMICGSMGTQPFYEKEYGRLELPNVSIIDKFGPDGISNLIKKISNKARKDILSILNKESLKMKSIIIK